MPTEQGRLGKSNAHVKCLSTDQFTSLFISQESHVSMLTPEGWRSCILLFAFVTKTANIIGCIQTVKTGAGEVARRLRTRPALSEDSSLDPLSRSSLLPLTPSPRDQMSSSGPHGVYTHGAFTKTHREIKNSKRVFFTFKDMLHVSINTNRNTARLLSLYSIINKNS